MRVSYDTAKGSERTAASTNNWGSTASEKFSTALGFQKRRQVENDYQCAVKLQADLERQDQGGFHGKNERQSTKGKKLSTDSSTSFPCMSCSVEGREYDMVCISPCCHRFCRSCLGEYVLSSLHQNRFPIPCPMCAAYDETPFKSSREPFSSMPEPCKP